MIGEIRKDEGKDVYEGVEKLYHEMKEYEKGIIKRI